MELRPRTTAGFTIVELITVIILLGILSIVALPRFVKPSAFAPGVVSHGLVAETRIAQQLAISRVDAIVSMWVEKAGDDWRIRIDTNVDGQIRSTSLSAYNTAVQASSGATTATLGAATPLVVTFAHSGDLAAVQIGAVAGDATLGVDLQISGDSSRAACIYGSGYATDAACS